MNNYYCPECVGGPLGVWAWACAVPLGVFLGFVLWCSRRLWVVLLVGLAITSARADDFFKFQNNGTVASGNCFIIGYFNNVSNFMWSFNASCPAGGTIGGCSGSYGHPNGMYGPGCTGHPNDHAYSYVGWSIFIRHHHGDGGLRIVNVERAASGDQFDEARTVVVVADIQGDGDAVATWAGADDPETGHPDNIPKASSFVLAGHAFRHGDVIIKHGAGQKHREFDSRLLRGLGHVHLHAVGNGLRSRVGVNDFAKRRFVLICFHGVSDSSV